MSVLKDAAEQAEQAGIDSVSVKYYSQSEYDQVPHPPTNFQIEFGRSCR
jgi:hypothetical protein